MNEMIVNTQPLAAPASLIFYLRWRYSEHKKKRHGPLPKLDWKQVGF